MDIEFLFHMYAICDTGQINICCVSFSFWLMFVSFDKVFLCSPHWSGAQYVTQAKLPLAWHFPALTSQVIRIIGIHHLLASHNSWPNIPGFVHFLKSQQGSGGMVQWVKALAMKAWWLSLIPGTHVKVEREAIPQGCSITSTQASWHPPP